MSHERVGWLALAFGIAWLTLELVVASASAQCPNGQCSRPAQRPAAVQQYTPQQIGRFIGDIRRANGRWMLNTNRTMPWKLQYRRGVRR